MNLLSPYPIDEKNITAVFKELWNCKARFILNFGGTASSKSFSAAQKEVVIANQQPVKTLVIRKVGNTLRDSVIPSFRSRISELEYTPMFTYNKTDRVITHDNGSQIIFRGLDDPEKLKSFEGLQRILVEEAAELQYEDFLELNRRARGRDDIQITLCFNPIHEGHWIKKHFCDNNIDLSHSVKSTYHNNPFLTDIDREQIENMRMFNNNQYRIYALGEWGVSENNLPWLYSFNKETHIARSLPVMPGYSVYLSFDFNREPVTCVAAQMSPHKAARDSFIHFVKEFSANGQLSELCTRIKTAFPASTLYVTGDASGNRGDIGFDSRHATYYQMIRSYLNLSEKQMDINSKNLSHSDSRVLINTLLYEYPSIKLSQEGCPLLINDCIIARIDEDSNKPGTLKKDRNIYKMDLFDAFRYFFQTYFYDYAGKVKMKKTA